MNAQDRIDQLENELERVKRERDELRTQTKNLVAKNNRQRELRQQDRREWGERRSVLIHERAKALQAASDAERERDEAIVRARIAEWHTPYADTPTPRSLPTAP